MVVKFGIFSCSAQCQLCALLALCALTQSIHATVGLQQTTSAIVSLSSTNNSDSENCVIYTNMVYCRESDHYCLTATYTNLYASNEDYINADDEILSRAVICKKQSKYIAKFFDNFHSADNNKRLELFVKNIDNLPVKLFVGNMSYKANLQYESNTDDIVNLLSHANGMRELVLEIKSYVADEKWLGAFLRFQNALKRCKLTLLSTDAAVILPLDSFSKLNALEELKIFIIHSKRAAQTVTTAHTSLRNLTRAHFTNLIKLKCLHLIGNNMQTIERDLFSALHALHILSLRGNQLRQLAPDLFAAQHKLYELDLGNNQLDYLSTELFTHTPLLLVLRLDRNRLHALENMLTTLKPLNYLRLLDLSHNQFVYIAHGNETLITQIKRKQLPTDDLKQIYQSVPYTMQVLDISHNRLTNFSLDWLTRVELACNVHIRLTNNHIRHFYALAQPASVTPNCSPVLHMEKNPLHCDCHLAWIYNLDFLHGNTISTSTTNWHCATPTHLRGRSLRMLQRNALCQWSPIFCPAMCVCRKSAQDFDALIINCTGADASAALAQLPRPEQMALTQTTLYIERCNLTTLPARINAGYANVTRLYAAMNNITTLALAHLPPTLLYLDLRANNLQRLSAEFLAQYLNESAHLQALYLSGNPWLCDCEAMQLLYTLRLQRARIPDIEKLYCADRKGVALLRVQLNDICRKRAYILTSVIAPLFALALTAFILLILIALYYKYKIEVKIWLYAHNLCALWINEDELDENKTFDAFISYAHQQNDYVNHVLLPGLEQGQPRFRICIHERNWLVGACIPDQIVKSVEQSCRTIFVLSQDFIASDWGRMEFRTAHQSALDEGRARIIVIKYGELSQVQRLDKELQAYLKLNTYLEWNDPRFWQKLRYALPHRKRIASSTETLKLARRVYIPD